MFLSYLLSNLLPLEPPVSLAVLVVKRGDE
jgi:hypothetical protein